MDGKVRMLTREREADLPEDEREARRRFRAACHRIGLQVAPVEIARALHCDESSVRRWFRAGSPTGASAPARALIAAERIAEKRSACKSAA